MKYIFLLLISFPLLAQEQVEFSFGYQTNTKVVIETEIDTEMEMSYQGDVNSIPENMRTRLPINIIGKEVKTQNVTTGKLATDGSFPIKMHVSKDRKYYSINGSQMLKKKADASSMEGVTINGKGLPNGDLLYISSEGDKVTSELEAIFKSVFSQLGKVKELNGKKVSVGETISVEVPMSVPVANEGVINFNMGMNYKLNAIEGGIANFDVLYSTVVEMETKSGELSIKGSGQGKMTYDTTKLYTPDMDSIMVMDMSIPMGNGNLITKNTSSSKVSIRLN